MAAAAAAAGYFVGGLHELAGWLDPFRFVSSFWWVGKAPLSNGVDYSHQLVLAQCGAGSESEGYDAVAERHVGALGYELARGRFDDGNRFSGHC